MFFSVVLTRRAFLSSLSLWLLLPVAPGTAQDIPKTQATPTAVARESFDALKRRDVATFVSLFHPDETKRFKAFALDVFRYEEPDEEIEQVRKLLLPFDSTERVTAASGSDLLAAFLDNSLASIPGYDEIMADAKLQILGEIVERPDKVHVVSRTVMPRPQPVSCRNHDGRWYLLLNDDTMRMITALERKEHFRKKKGALEDLVQKMKMDEIDVIGYVRDGEDVAQVLCRIKMKIDDFDFSVFGCYPVRESEAAWKHLSDTDPTQLVEALRAKWAP